MATSQSLTAAEREGLPPSAQPEDVLVWAEHRFSGRIALTCSFGGFGGMVLAHMVAIHAPTIPILFIDTGLLFPETYALKREIAERYGLQVMTCAPRLSVEEQATLYGDRLWEHDPHTCCQLRKVQPMAAAVNSLKAWITALRRDQSPSRASVEILEYHSTDQGHSICKLNPLAHWSRGQVCKYLHRHQVPYNPLLDNGYHSLGCRYCTSQSDAHAPERAGRWTGQDKVECGLHTFTKVAVVGIDPD